MNKITVAFLISFVLVCGCSQEDNPQIANSIELYLLKSYTLVNETCQINELTCQLEESPLIKYDEFISYQPGEHTFKISESAISKIKQLDETVAGIAFAITADGDIVYTGYFWSVYSSLGCMWNVAYRQYIGYVDGMQIHNSYPESVSSPGYPDNRNHPLIVETFRKDKKLVE